MKGRGTWKKSERTPVTIFNNACLDVPTTRIQFVSVFHNLNHPCFLLVKITFVIFDVRQVSFTSLNKDLKAI